MVADAAEKLAEKLFVRYVLSNNAKRLFAFLILHFFLSVK
jgi:hypothetical protein